MVKFPHALETARTHARKSSRSLWLSLLPSDVVVVVAAHGKHVVGEQIGAANRMHTHTNSPQEYTQRSMRSRCAQCFWTFWRSHTHARTHKHL